MLSGHYANHAKNFYSWSLRGLTEYDLLPGRTKTAIDPGAGRGVQIASLAKAGYAVREIDFNRTLCVILPKIC
jgi:hypothetical protein